MKKICFLIGSINHSGGTERVTTLIANTLEHDNEVHILSLSEGDNPFFQQNLGIINESLFNHKVSMKNNFLSAVIKIRNYLINNQIDTLIVVDSISCIFTVPACIGLNTNHICWEHFNLKVNLGSRFRDVGRWMASKWCTKIVTLTERDKIFWEEKFNLKKSNKVVAIANPSPYEVQDNQPALEQKIILCVGRLNFQKGFDLLILAWAKIFRQLDGWKIVIVGMGEDEIKLKKMAIEYEVDKSIEFVGQQKNMDLFYRQASFFCMSSRFEGLPMVLLEAQSYGLPIVSFNCDTGPAEVIKDNQNGFLVDPMNIDDLSNKILKASNLSKNEYQRIVNFSFQNGTYFNIKTIFEKWLKVI